jgi:hypothetical protein
MLEDRLNQGETPTPEDVARELAEWIYGEMRMAHAEDMADPNAQNAPTQTDVRLDYLEAACELAEVAGPYAPPGLADWIVALQKPSFVEQIPLN